MIEYPDLFDPMANRAFARNTAPDPSRGKPLQDRNAEKEQTNG